MSRNAFRLSMLAALLVSTASPVAAAPLVFDPPAVDRWNYPFNGSPGVRPNAPLFGAFATAGQFDQRDGQMLVIFDTAPAIPAGRPANAYQITSIRLVFDRNPANAWVYDATYDGYRTYLALENPSDPNALPDTDAGRPMELYGVGYRLSGLDATTYNETTTLHGPGVFGQGVRYAYPNDNYASPTLFGNRDVSNNVLGAFNPLPFAIGVIPGATPGQTVTGAGTVEFNVALASQVIAYLQARLALGSVDFMVTSLEPAAQGGASVYPVLLTKEGGGAPTLEIDVTVTPACADGVDNDGDGFTDFSADIGCFAATDDHEAYDCQNGLDDDGDGFTDFPNDPGCRYATSHRESPQCSDGIANDADGLTDYPADLQCQAAWDNSEKAQSSCGLFGIEMAPLVGWQIVARRRARRRARA